MTIFESIHQLKNCILECEEYFSQKEYVDILQYIDNAKLYDFDDRLKQQMCNTFIGKVLVKNGITKGYLITEWLEKRKEEYVELIAYVEQEIKWKTNIV
tara:strand:+ start:219 stop:515 length:297 start_codon:yes stop_codon:yes gene_type:complete